MTQSHYIIAANFDGRHYVLTNEGYKDSARHDALSFLSKDAALNEFNNTEAAGLIRHGWAGYHTVNLIVTEYTVDADGEVSQRVVAEKTVTVDDEAQANARLIAAAPDMLAALEAIAAIPDPKTGDRGPIKHARHIAKVAIAKAKGGEA